jgi:hypothetical protein
MVSGEGQRPVSAERRLEELGIQLPAAPTPFGNYVEALQTGNLLFLSGMLPVVAQAEVSRPPRERARCANWARCCPHRRFERPRGRETALGLPRQSYARRSARRLYGNLRGLLRSAPGRGCRIGPIPRCLWSRQDIGSAGDWRGQPSSRNAHRTRSHPRNSRVGRDEECRQRQEHSVDRDQRAFYVRGSCCTSWPPGKAFFIQSAMHRQFRTGAW